MTDTNASYGIPYADSVAFLRGVPLTELHTHLGFSVSATMMWEMAHEQGIKLPTKDYWEFQQMITIHERKSYEEYLRMYDVIEHIQSSPESLFTAIQHSVSGAYQKTNIETLELRFNPILRNRKGERDLDRLVVFALQGMERAMLKYPVKAGIILMMDRRFTHAENAGIVKKAIQYHHRGVIGVDLAGPVTRTDQSKSFAPSDIADLVAQAREAGLGVTIHTGEATGLDEMWAVVEELKPDRIGHGIVCVQDEKLMAVLAEQKIVLELCPTSNINTSLVKSYAEFGEIIATLKAHNVLFTINTDGPEVQQISLLSEYQTLLEHNILTPDEVLACNELAHRVSFLHRPAHKHVVHS